MTHIRTPVYFSNVRYAHEGMGKREKKKQSGERNTAAKLISRHTHTRVPIPFFNSVIYFSSEINGNGKHTASARSRVRHEVLPARKKHNLGER